MCIQKRLFVYMIMQTLPEIIAAHRPQWETVAVLKRLAAASRSLAELKGVAASVPNPAILINSLAMQEAKDSSAIENIVTTHDELYRETLFPELDERGAAKEVRFYVQALRTGYDLVQQNGFLSANHLRRIQAELENNDAGYRKLPGTELKNEQTGETVYVPPQNPAEIVALMRDLENFLNNDEMLDADPLIKMAIAHHQFESIHPFYDGNGRTGRILNVLYLVQQDLLDIPVLYLSRYINRTKSEYYRLLQRVRVHGDWEAWVLYMLQAVEETSQQTIVTVSDIKTAFLDYKHRIRERHKFYSQDLINNLFAHPYTKIELVEEDLRVGRLTATKYLDTLAADGFLEKQKVGRYRYYINTALYEILTRGEPITGTETP